jgi:methyl-accepting chemotaxis protein
MPFLNNLKVANKLALGFGFCLALYAISVYIGVSRMQDMNAKMKSITEVANVESSTASKFIGDFRHYRILILRMCVSGDATIFDQLEAGRLQDAAIVQQDLENYDKLATDPADRANLDKAKAAWAKIGEYRGEILKEARGVNLNAKSPAAMAESQKSLRNIGKLQNVTAQPYYQEADNTANDMVAWNQKHASDLAVQANATYENARNTILAFFIWALVGCVALGVVITRTIVSSLNSVVSRLKSLDTICIRNLRNAVGAAAEGDLTQKIETGTQFIDIQSKDEFGELGTTLNSMIKQAQETIEQFRETQKSLSHIIGQASAAAEGISEAASHIAAGMGDFAEGNLNVKVDANIKRTELDAKGDFVVLAKSFSNIFDSTSQILTAFQSAQSSLNAIVGQANASAKGIGSAATHLASGMSAFAEGDLTAKVPQMPPQLEIASKGDFAALSMAFDEIYKGTAKVDEQFRETQKTIYHIVNQASDAAKSISASSDNIASGMGELAEGNLGVKINFDSARVEIDAKGDFSVLAKSFSKIFDSSGQIVAAFGSAQKSLASLVGQANASAKGISVSATHLASGMAELAEGNLTIKLPPMSTLTEIASKGDFAALALAFDEIYEGTAKIDEAFRHTQSSLSEIMGHALVVSEQIAAASTQLASGNENLASRTSEQAASLEETAASMEEMTSVVKLSADNSKHASKVASESKSLAIQGGEVVQGLSKRCGASMRPVRRLSISFPLSMISPFRPTFSR